MTTIEYRDTREILAEQILRLYRANRWSAARKPRELCRALASSHSVVSAWDDGELVGLGNAISDGFLVVYYPHLLVLPAYQRRGIGRRIMEIMQARYGKLHQQVLLAVDEALPFYERCGFRLAAGTRALWVYEEEDR